MHRIYYPLKPEAEKKNGGELFIEGPAHHYLSRVVRLGVGDRVVLFDESGYEWVARILELDRNRVRVVLEQRRENRCEPRRVLWLLQGYPKGKKFSEILRGAVALGVAGILPFEAERSVGGRGGKSGAWLERCGKIALEAARQCGRCRVPVIQAPAGSLAEALESVLGNEKIAMEGKLQGVCLWEEAETPLAQWLPKQISTEKVHRPWIVVIGPEGGLTKQEAKQAQDKGLAQCHLGPRILRTELAPLAVLSILQFELGQME